MTTVRDILTTLLTPVRAAIRHLHQWAHLVGAQVRQAWDRHTDRLDTDRGYRRALVTAVTALATTMVPNPALAAALGVWIADTPTTRPPRRPVEPEYDPDDEDDPPPWRPRATLWTTFGE